MEWKQQPELVEKEVRIGEINVRPFHHDPERVEKIIFCSDTGDITFKPKILQEEFKGGIKYTSLVSCKTSELPEIVSKIGVLIASKGFAIVKAKYMRGSMEKDGSEVVYRFVQGDKMLERWNVSESQNPVTSSKEEVIK